MIAIGSREALIQNLEDAGCEPEMIRDFLSGLSDLPDTGKPDRCSGYVFQGNPAGRRDS